MRIRWFRSLAGAQKKGKSYTIVNLSSHVGVYFGWGKAKNAGGEHEVRPFKVEMAVSKAFTGVGANPVFARPLASTSADFISKANK